MAKNLSELLAVEHRTAEDRIAAPRPTAPMQSALAPPDDDTGVAMVTVRFDTQILARVDAAAKRLGINRVAWLHLAAEKLLEGPALIQAEAPRRRSMKAFGAG
jgi:hypothetical protein